MILYNTVQAASATGIRKFVTMKAIPVKYRNMLPRATVIDVHFVKSLPIFQILSLLESKAKEV